MGAGRSGATRPTVEAHVGAPPPCFALEAREGGAAPDAHEATSTAKKKRGPRRGILKFYGLRGESSLGRTLEPDGDVTEEELPTDLLSASIVLAVCRRAHHGLSKILQDEITLVEGLGVEGDAHAGATVQHRSRIEKTPGAPNLRQVHLLHAELHAELRSKGFELGAGQMGENITTRGVELLRLPVGARLRLGSEATVELTGLRNPCAQLNGLAEGLMKAVLDHDAEGKLVRKAGVMGVVVRSGVVRPGDPIVVSWPPRPHAALERV